MKHEFKEKGFTVVEGVVVAIVLVALAAGGWYVWRGNGDKGDSQSAATERAEQTKNETQQNEVTENTYLVIQEWGVKLPLSDEIEKAYYEFSRDGTGEYASLFDAGFDELKNDNGISCGTRKHQFFSISRARTSDVPGLENPDSPTFQGPGPDFKKFPFTDEYEFGGLRQHQAGPPCAILSLNPGPYDTLENDTNILRIADAKETAFSKAFDGMIAND